MQKEGRRRRRPDPRKIEVCGDDPLLTGVAGLVGFGAYLRVLGVDAALREQFGHLKTSHQVVYPMHVQMRLLLDAVVSGEARVFGLEKLAADPLFVLLAGGAVPSIDTVYDDLARFGEPELVALEAMMAEHGLAPLRGKRWKRIHLDVDTTVEPLFGRAIEGAVPGPNPHYHGRPCYHPMLMRVAELDTLAGAVLRPGDTSFGNADVPTIVAWIERVRRLVGPHCTICVRVDAAGDCTALMAALDAMPNVTFVVKADMTPDLCFAIQAQTRWNTVDPKEGERPMVQTAQIAFARNVWAPREGSFRVVAVRSRIRDNGKQLYLWAGLDWTVQAYITNDHAIPEAEVGRTYNLRAGIEPLIADLKNGVGIGRVPTQVFDANHAMFLHKLLAFNLERRYTTERFPALRAWRTPWLHRALILQPGRLTRSGRHRTLHIHPASSLVCYLN